jgi:hypothetical protein
MRLNRFTATILVVTCALFLQSGCEEEQAVVPQQLSPDWFRQFDQPARQAQPAATARARVSAPKIAFEKIVHDFGVVGPETSSLCEFAFKNTGTGILRIGEINSACGCTTFALDKTEYAPGETGALRVKYSSDTQLGPTTKDLLVSTNDATNPEVTLAIQATVTAKVDYEPKTLNLVLRQENAGCPAITVASIDNQPFAITHFTSTGNYITADFNPSVQATSFVLQPKVDMAGLANTPHGVIEIGLSHPECKKVTVGVNALSRFRVFPPLFTIRGVEANKPIVKKVQILSNYDEPFELASAASENGTVKVLSNTTVSHGYELELQITPPADRARVFSETFFVNIKNGGQLQIPCRVFYSGAAPAAPRPAAAVIDTKTCPTCGPKVIDPTTGAVSYGPKPNNSGS